MSETAYIDLNGMGLSIIKVRRTGEKLEVLTLLNRPSLTEEQLEEVKKLLDAAKFIRGPFGGKRIREYFDWGD